MSIIVSPAMLSRLNFTLIGKKNAKKVLQIISGSFNRLHVAGVASNSKNETGLQDGMQKEKISKAMRAYLERARKHDEFLQKETTEFNIGKRHLANMMGINPETITQEEINNSIEYLFPSGIYDWRARPMMRPPAEIFPLRKAAEFDASGRPFHSMFYTTKPNYYQLLYDIVEAINLLKRLRLSSGDSNVNTDFKNEFNLIGSTWLSKAELEQILLEPLIDRDHTEFVQAMERLITYPGLHNVKDLLTKYRKPLINQAEKLVIPKPEYNAEGRPYVTTKQCMRKSARGEVTIIGKGSGKITINGKSLLYFDDIQAREQVIFPLIFTGLSSTVDVDATVTGGGPSGQAGAVRWGIAWGLRSFVDADMVERMRIAGLLKRDHRVRERKKPGQAGAREKFTWKKR